MNKILESYIRLTTLNVFVLPITIYLIAMHYKPEASEFCVYGGSFDCDIVNKSIYAEFYGIPVALLGTITYLILLAFSIRGKFVDQTKLIPYAIAFVAAGVLFSLRLTYIEAFVLETWCIFCLIQQIVILLQLGELIYIRKLTK